MKPFQAQTYYELLEVSVAASAAEIRGAHERLSRLYGDDQVALYGLIDNSQAQSLRAKLDEALQVLIDEARREAYDQKIGLPPRDGKKPAGPARVAQPSAVVATTSAHALTFSYVGAQPVAAAASSFTYTVSTPTSVMTQLPAQERPSPATAQALAPVTQAAPRAEPLSVAAPAPQPLAEPVPKPAPASVPDSVAELTQPVAEPVTQAVVELVAQAVAAPVTQPAAESVTPAVAEPVTQPVAESVSQAVAAPVTQPAAESVSPPAAESAPPPVVAPPVAGGVSPPAAEPVLPPAAESASQAVAAPVTQPVAESVSPVAEDRVPEAPAVAPPAQLSQPGPAAGSTLGPPLARVDTAAAPAVASAGEARAPTEAAAEAGDQGTQLDLELLPRRELITIRHVDEEGDDTERVVEPAPPAPAPEPPSSAAAVPIVPAVPAPASEPPALEKDKAAAEAAEKPIPRLADEVEVAIVPSRPIRVEPKPKPHEIPPGVEVNGDLLRQVRMARGLTLLQLAERTRISAKHLENVETDRYDALPAGVYLRGILMNLARELGLDGLRVAKSYLAFVDAHRSKG